MFAIKAKQLLQVAIIIKKTETMKKTTASQEESKGPRNEVTLTNEQEIALREVTDDFSLRLNDSSVKDAILLNPILSKIDKQKLKQVRKNEKRK